MFGNPVVIVRKVDIEFSGEFGVCIFKVET
jgi:hypothetical protein